MFDLHTHIIPGIDDGATDLETAEKMLDIAALHGTSGLVVTPHTVEGDWLPAWERIVAGCEVLRQSAKVAGLTLDIYPGAEVALSMDILKVIAGPGPYCINGGSYLLVELPALEIPSYTDEFFFTLQTKGITPVLAHPERNPEVAKDLNRLREWIEHGVLVQMNAPSINGRMGPEVAATAKRMVECRMVHAIGSDAHGIHSRRPILSEAAGKILRFSDEEYLLQIVRDNPLRMIENGEITVQPVRDFQALNARRGFVKRLGEWWRRNAI